MNDKVTVAQTGSSEVAHSVKHLKRLLLVVMAAVITLVAAGCHTVKGAGQDIGGAGRAVERSSGK